MSTTTGFVKSIDSPDEIREMPNARLDLVKVDDLVVGRLVAQPGWKWSESVKPIAQTDSCEVPHQLYVLSGALHVQLDDGTELDLVRGDIAIIPAGHDAWVVGDEPCAMLDFSDEDDGYATPPAS